MNDVAQKPRPKPATPAKQLEAKDVRWKRLANGRVPRAIKAIKQLSSLANRSLYDYTPEQSQKIIDLLHDAVNTVALAYQTGKQSALLKNLFD